MKHLLVIIFLLFTLNAKEEQNKQKVTIGFGPYMQTQPYKDLDPFSVISPIIFFDNSLFYVRWTRVGLYFLGNKSDEVSWGFSLTARPRIYGYNAEESEYLEGMDNIDTTFEGGIAFSATYNKAHIEIMLLTDMLIEQDTWIFATEIGDEFKLGSFMLYPSFILIYQSDAFVNHYYGVQEHEATQIREEFTPGGGWQVGGRIFLKYPLTDKLSVLANVRVDRLAQSALDSPLIDNEYIYSGLFSLIYTFEY